MELRERTATPCKPLQELRGWSFGMDLRVRKRAPCEPGQNPNRNPNRTKRMCYNCDACNLKVDCGKCDFCQDQPKFGGKNLLRQKCRMRQCSLFSKRCQEDGRHVNDLKMARGGVIKALYYGPKEPSSKNPNQNPNRNPNRKKRMCYNCDACNLKVDCGKCDFCQDQPKFGGKNLLRQKCRMRQCSRFSKRCQEDGRHINDLKMACGGVVKALYYGPKEPSSKNPNQNPNRNPNRKKRMCYNCDACNLKVDCGKCDFCQDQPKFGGKNLLRQKCRMRQCSLFSKFITPDLRCGSQDLSTMVPLTSPHSNEPTPSKAIHTSSRSTPQRLHHHSATRSQKVEERKERQRESKRRWRMKRKLLQETEKDKQLIPGKASHPCFKGQPQVLLNGKFKLKHLQVGGQHITFRDLFVKLCNLMESMKDQNLNKKARYLQVGDQRIRIRDPLLKLQNMCKNMNGQTFSKETSRAPSLTLSSCDSQEGEESHAVDSESMNENPEAIPLPQSTDISLEEEGSQPVESEAFTVAPIGCPRPPSMGPFEGEDSRTVLDNESITVVPMCDSLEAERLVPVASECIATIGSDVLVCSNEAVSENMRMRRQDAYTQVGSDDFVFSDEAPSEVTRTVRQDAYTQVPRGFPPPLSRNLLQGEGPNPADREGMTTVPRSCPPPLSRKPLQDVGSNPVDSEGMTLINSKLLVLATIFYKKMEIRKRKYRILTIKELIETCKEELDCHVHGKHSQLERIQIYDTDFSEYVDFDMSTDDVRDKDRFLIYFGDSRCQCTDCYLDPGTISTESSNDYPSKPRQSPPSDIDDYLIQEKEETERDSHMPVIMEIVSLGSCLAVSRRGKPR